ncbi:unnamed protein product, partial [Prorocentrum cordatum]
SAAAVRAWAWPARRGRRLAARQAVEGRLAAALSRVAELEGELLRARAAPAAPACAPTADLEARIQAEVEQRLALIEPCIDHWVRTAVLEDEEVQERTAIVPSQPRPLVVGMNTAAHQFRVRAADIAKMNQKELNASQRGVRKAAKRPGARCATPWRQPLGRQGGPIQVGGRCARGPPLGAERASPWAACPSSDAVPPGAAKPGEADAHARLPGGAGPLGLRFSGCDFVAEEVEESVESVGGDDIVAGEVDESEERVGGDVGFCCGPSAPAAVGAPDAAVEAAGADPGGGRFRNPGGLGAFPIRDAIAWADVQEDGDNGRYGDVVDNVADREDGLLAHDARRRLRVLQRQAAGESQGAVVDDRDVMRPGWQAVDALAGSEIPPLSDELRAGLAWLREFLETRLADGCGLRRLAVRRGHVGDAAILDSPQELRARLNNHRRR